MFDESVRHQYMEFAFILITHTESHHVFCLFCYRAVSKSTWLSAVLAVRAISTSRSHQACCAIRSARAVADVPLIIVDRGKNTALTYPWPFFHVSLQTMKTFPFQARLGWLRHRKLKFEAYILSEWILIVGQWWSLWSPCDKSALVPIISLLNLS